MILKPVRLPNVLYIAYRNQLCKLWHFLTNQNGLRSANKKLSRMGKRTEGDEIAIGYLSFHNFFENYLVLCLKCRKSTSRTKITVRATKKQNIRKKLSFATDVDIRSDGQTIE
jgi:hypothetical protein